MTLMDAVKTRRSIRKYTSDPIPQNDLDILLHAASCAPVGAGVEVKYTVVTNKDVLKKMAASTAALRNQGTGFDPFYGAPMLVILSAPPHPIGCDVQNAACAAQNMMLAATDLGIGSVYLLGFTVALKGSEELQKLVDIPEGCVPVLGVALGYADGELPDVTPPKNISVNYVK